MGWLDESTVAMPARLSKRLVLLAAFFLCVGFGQAAAQTATLLRNHPDDVGEIRQAGRAAPYRELDLRIVLALRNQATLDELLAEQQDPASRQYHHWLTPGEFA